MDEVASILRSCLLTVKGGTTIDQLNRDYKAMEGENIPFRKLGFSNIHDFLKNVPNLLTSTRNGIVYVEAIATAKTAHIQYMVSLQRNSKKRSMNKSPRFQRRPNITSLYNNARNQSTPARRSNPPTPSWTSSWSNPSSNGRNMFAFSSGPASHTASRSNGSTFNTPNFNMRSVTAPSTPPASQAASRSNGFTVNTPNFNMRSVTAPCTPPTSQAANRSNGITSNTMTSSNTSVVSPSTLPANPAVNPRNSLTVTVSTNTDVRDVSVFPTPAVGQAANNNNGFTANTLASSNMISIAPSNTLPLTEVANMRNNVIASTSTCQKSPEVSQPSRIGYKNTAPIYEPPHTKISAPLVRPQSIKDRLIINPGTVSLKPKPGNDNIQRQVNTTNIVVPTVSLSPTARIVDSQPLQYDDPRAQLERLARRLKVSDPQYHFCKIGTGTFYCTAEVGQNKISSYPASANNPADAAKLAAQMAVTQLESDLISRPELPITYNLLIIKQRIIEITDDHPGGIIKNEVPEFYQEKYQEKLPPNWVDVIAQFPMDLTMEKNVTGISILYRYTPMIEQRRELPNVSSSQDSVLAKMVYPTDHYWDVYVTRVSSANEIYINLIGSSYIDLYLSMSQELALFYSNQLPTKTVTVGQYYVANDGDTWERVRVESVNHSGDTAEVFFIDTGHRESLSCKLLYTFEKRFYDVPAQAIRLSLLGCEDLADYYKATAIITEKLLYNRFYVNFVITPAENEDVSSATFWDTATNIDIEINKLIREELLSNYKAPTFSKNEIYKVFISHVETTGNVYVRVDGEGLQLLHNLVNEVSTLNADALEAARPLYTSEDEVYLIRGPNGNWQRAKLLKDSTVDHYTFSLLLIDDGRTIKADTTQLLDIPKASPLLVGFPPQATNVKLLNVDDSAFDQALVNRLIVLAPQNLSVLCKVISADSQPPVVELFKRYHQENALISINSTLSICPELEKPSQDGNNNNN